MFFAQTHTREPDDDELLRRLRQTGQDSCFGTLYSRYIPLLYGVCLKYLQRQDLAEDAVMALFEELQPKIARYEIREFRTWIYSAAKNHCLQQLRKTKREIPHEPDARFMESAGITHLLDEPEAVSRNEPLKACLEELPEPQRISIPQRIRHRKPSRLTVCIERKNFRFSTSTSGHGTRNDTVRPVTQKSRPVHTYGPAFARFRQRTNQASCRLSTISRCSLKNCLRWISLLCEISVE